MSVSEATECGAPHPGGRVCTVPLAGIGAIRLDGVLVWAESASEHEDYGAAQQQDGQTPPQVCRRRDEADEGAGDEKADTHDQIHKGDAGDLARTGDVGGNTQCAGDQSR